MTDDPLFPQAKPAVVRWAVQAWRDNPASRYQREMEVRCPRDAAGRYVSAPSARAMCAEELRRLYEGQVFVTGGTRVKVQRTHPWGALQVSLPGGEMVWLPEAAVSTEPP